MCMVLGLYLNTGAVSAAHLVSLSDRNIIPFLGFTNIWDERNGILVYSCIDKKYGSLEITFVPNFVTHNIELRIMYDDILDGELNPPIRRATAGITGTGNVTYRDLHLRPLRLPPLVFPFRRAFVRHAESAYRMLEGNSRPHTVGSLTAPTEEEWETMLEQ